MRNGRNVKRRLQDVDGKWSHQNHHHHQQVRKRKSKPHEATPVPPPPTMPTAEVAESPTTTVTADDNDADLGPDKKPKTKKTKNAHTTPEPVLDIVQPTLAVSTATMSISMVNMYSEILNHPMPHVGGEFLRLGMVPRAGVTSEEDDFELYGHNATQPFPQHVTVSLPPEIFSAACW